MLITLLAILTWYFTSKHAEKSVSVVASALRDELLARTQDSTRELLQANNASTLSLAGFLGSPLLPMNFSAFSTLEEQVRPALFLVYYALRDKYQVSFFGNNRMFLSYSSEFNDTSLVFANSSYPSSFMARTRSLQSEVLNVLSPYKQLSMRHTQYNCYRQPADAITGLPTGDAIPFVPVPYWESELFNTSLHSESGTSWGFLLSGSGSLLFFSLSPVRQSHGSDPIGVAVIGISMEKINTLLTSLSFKGGSLYMTTDDNRLLAQTGDAVVIKVGSLGVPILPSAMSSNNSVVAGAARYLVSLVEGNMTLLSKKVFRADRVLIGGTEYTVDSAPMQVADITLVFVMVLPRNSIWGPTDSRSHVALASLVVLATCVGMVGCFFILVLTKGVSNEIQLRAALFQQLEATKQAESRNSHKSIVFASMSHDLRTPLAAILGLIDLCLCDATESSELESNLFHMKSCATNLLGILNTILDMSKIEAGKLELEETEFNLVSVMEEVVDMFAVLGVQKGIEVVLDLPDESIQHVAHVKGDSGRVKQLLSNLLSNGVKFTSEGHVVLRAWPKQRSSASALCSCDKVHSGVFGSLGKHLQHILSDKNKKYEELDANLDSSRTHNEIEFEFDVEDTGKGIPLERRKAVFENFVQGDSSVPRTHGGTGLGLGIVYSLVCLMGGDISIIDKDQPGEPGTRFRFNLIFPCAEEQPEKQKQHRNYPKIPAGVRLSGGPAFQAPSVSTLNMSTDGGNCLHRMQMSSFGNLPQVDGIHVLLAMQGQAGKQVVKRWMEQRGLQVWSVSHWDEFLPMFERIKQRQSEVVATSSDIQAQGMSRDDSVSSSCGSLMKNERISGTGILVVVDLALAPDSLEEVFLALEGGLPQTSAMVRVVWLLTANTPGAALLRLKRKKGAIACHLVLHKPLHGSRLQSLWNQVSIWGVVHKLLNLGPSSRDLSTSLNPREDIATCLENRSDSKEIREDIHPQKDLASVVAMQVASTGSVASTDVNLVIPLKRGTRESEIMGPADSLAGMHILVAEDNRVLQKLTKTMLLRLGATVVCVDNGAEAAQLVLANLPRPLGSLVSYGSLKKRADSKGEVHEDEQVQVQVSTVKPRPFDLVLMDCQMPVLDGYGATQRIREQERQMGWHTPVIALTAHAMAKDESKCIEAGMDFYLTKPLATKALLAVAAELNSSR
ncbi:unnamed protein product [Sphagnum jensenii]|uniref:histidine kinase n=1 Tax=Sphagnum jensenii TaxID=128206 RepID=A0ABP0WXK0_9BRYO